MILILQRDKMEDSDLLELRKLIEINKINFIIFYGKRF